MAEPHPEAGWYVVRRVHDGAVSCLYTAGDGWWAMHARNRNNLPAGWRLGPRLDALLDLFEHVADARPARRRRARPDQRDHLGDG